MKEKFTKLFGALLLVALMLGLVLPFQTAAAQDIPGTVTFTVAADDGVSLNQVNLTITDTTVIPATTYYNIYRSFTESGVRTALSNNLPYAGVATFADTTAIAGTVYWYWVEACDTTSCTAMVGNDGWRAVTSLPFLAGTLTATAGTFFDRIEVTINPPVGFALPVVGGYYKIQRQKVGTTTWTTVGSITTLLFKDTSAPGQPAAVGSVQPTYTYTVDVCGANKCNADNAAPVALNGTTAGAGFLNTVLNPGLTATSGDKKVALVWNSVTGAMNYYGQRAWGSLLQPATPLVFAPVTKPDTFIPATLYMKDDTTVVAGNVYVYYVWACYNATNCSQKVASAPVGPNPVVTVPADYKVSKGDDSTAPAAGVDISFTAKADPGGIYTYDLNRSDDSAGLVNVVTTPLVGTLAPTPGAPELFNDNGVNPGQSYYFWINVCDTTTIPATCATSSKLEGWSKVPPIAAATALFVSNTTGVSATWVALSVPNVYYKGWRNTTNSFSGALGPKNIFGTGGATIAGTDPTGTVGVTYWYYLQACVGSRCSAPIVGTGMKMP
jgi:hypothetical protein